MEIRGLLNTILSVTRSGSDNGSTKSEKLSDWIENKRLIIGESREDHDAVSTNVILCQVSVLDSERLATIIAIIYQPWIATTLFPLT